MTISKFTEELRAHWSWLYEEYLAEFYNQHLVKLYTREWATWELLTLAGLLTIFLLLKIRRRRRKAAAKIARLMRGGEEPTLIGIRPPGGNGYRRSGEDSEEQLLSGEEPHSERNRWRHRMDIVELSDQPVRQLRREIIKRDQAEARLEREVAELTIANERLQREVAESMRAEERLERKFVELAAANERLQREAGRAGRVEEETSEHAQPL